MTSLPRPEYPRPDRDRSDRWLNLNGTWRLESVDGVRDVVVPFAWESAASGVGRTWLERATYRRRISAPAAWRGSRVFLCFGAVHHRAEVALDGVAVGEHEGGYTSFEFDVTDRLEPGREAELTVDVHAPADKRAIPHGKQRSLPRDDYDGVSFTPSSGIWQTVWLEARGRTYADSVAVRGDSCDGFDLEIRVAGDEPAGAETRVVARATGETVVMTADAAGVARGRLPIAAPRLWSPDDPFLYELDVAVADDAVAVTAGLRSIAADGTRLLLNGAPLYVRGVLDQGYWPGTGITAPSDADLRRDLELARDAGYNLVRKHLKTEEPRFLHWADVLGVLVWAEPASTSRYSAAGAAAFEAQLGPMVERDGNHPSIVVWGLYNEEWGLDWSIPEHPDHAEAARRAYRMLGALDRSRPIVENSGWAHVETDILDWHYYDDDPGRWARTLAELADGRRGGFPVRLGPELVVEKTLLADGAPDPHLIPNLNSEYGGGFTSLERAWLLRWQTQELRRHGAFGGYVYTELTDVEHEMAGLFDADRRPKDAGGLSLSDVNAETTLVFDLVPRQAGTDLPTPEAGWTLPVRVSHHGTAPVTGELRATWLTAGRPLPPAPEAAAASCPASADPFALSAAAHLELPPPPTPRARLGVWLVDAEGMTRARGFVDVGPLEEPPAGG